MRFRIASEVVRVRVVAGALRDGTGKEVAGLWVWVNHEILISGDLPCQRRPEVLRHELRHAVRDLLGVPADEEGDCNQWATMSRDLERQLGLQGGEWALMRMGHAEPEHIEELAPSTAYAVECRCGSMIGLGGVVSSKPRLMDGRPVIDRACQCPDCCLWTCWTELVTIGGAPSGRIVSGPEYRKELAA